MSPRQLCPLSGRSVAIRPVTSAMMIKVLSMRLIRAKAVEQGDPLMPLLFSLEQHAALRAVQRQLQPQELVFAYLDDFHVVTTPGSVSNMLQIELWRTIPGGQRQDKVWNKSGVRLPKSVTRSTERREPQILTSQLCGEGRHWHQISGQFF